MKVGIMFANVMFWGTRDGAEKLAKAAEDNGIESLWTVEHVVVPAGYESAYPYSASGKMPGPETSSDPRPARVARVHGRTHEDRAPRDRRS